MPQKKIPKPVEREIQRYIRILSQDNLPIAKVILFGSWAKGKARKGSDIDLCIVSPQFDDTRRANQYLWSKREIFNLDYTIEPVGFSPKDLRDKYNSLIQEIKQTGIEFQF